MVFYKKLLILKYILTYFTSMIKITNKKVVDFYQANPNISIDHVNLLLVDMMEKNGT